MEVIRKFQNSESFKTAIGSFIIAFSKLEFGIVFLCSMTEFDIRRKDEYLLKYMGFAFEKKLDHLSSFIKENIPELITIWTALRDEIGKLNSERRFLIHGIQQYVLPNESISTHVKQNGKIVSKEFTVNEIKSLTNRINEVCTGRNGITGEFHTLFTKTRVNEWNKLVIEEHRVVYKVNNEIVSDWKGN